MMKIMLALVLGGHLILAAAGEVPTYLYAELSLPEEVLVALPQRAQSEGIPFAVAGVEGVLCFTGADSEETLLSMSSYLYLDGPFFLLGVEQGDGKAFLRGEAGAAALITLGDPAVLPRLAELMDRLGLLPEGTQVELSPVEVSLKLPAPPPGVRLDPVLWGLLISPDWFAFARDYGIERVGLRVRVVAEVEGMLPEEYEPYIQSSSDGLVELLLPIPLLDDLAQEEAVAKVRLPHKPHPLPPTPVKEEG